MPIKEVSEFGQRLPRHVLGAFSALLTCPSQALVPFLASTG